MILNSIKTDDSHQYFYQYDIQEEHFEIKFMRNV